MLIVPNKLVFEFFIHDYYLLFKPDMFLKPVRFGVGGLKFKQ